MAAALLAGALTTWATRPAAVDDPGDLRRASSESTAPRAIPGSQSVAPSGQVTTSSATGTPMPSGTSEPAPSPAPSRGAASVPAAPTRVVVPRLGARMAVAPVGVDRLGAMTIPEDPRVAGWYRFGAAPGGGAGATVLAAHVDDSEYGTGPLARLQTLRKGDAVSVTAGRTVHRYRVTSVLRLAKGELDTDELFDRGGPPRLHLVTCGGRFDRATGHYEDNVVVVATPVG
ncbi:class F sortase [Pedococcus aerophilus]|uniref:class F sortase n=1 Tax=Pedococcus aerophilus TaxID=436356 RepID=UPI0031CE8031